MIVFIFFFTGSCGFFGFFDLFNFETFKPSTGFSAVGRSNEMKIFSLDDFSSQFSNQKSPRKDKIKDCNCLSVEFLHHFSCLLQIGLTPGDYRTVDTGQGCWPRATVQRRYLEWLTGTLHRIHCFFSLTYSRFQACMEVYRISGMLLPSRLNFKGLLVASQKRADCFFLIVCCCTNIISIQM